MTDFINKLRRLNDVRLSVRGRDDKMLDGHVSLQGSARSIGRLPCSDQAAAHEFRSAILAVRALAACWRSASKLGLAADPPAYRQAEACIEDPSEIERVLVTVGFSEPPWDSADMSEMVGVFGLALETRDQDTAAVAWTALQGYMQLVAEVLADRAGETKAHVGPAATSGLPQWYGRHLQRQRSRRR